MPIQRYPRNQSTPVLVQQTPRNFARGDTPALALNDGGHGAGEVNPILYGLGGTLQFQFNSFVRTFRVYVEDTIDGPVTRQEITSFLRPVPGVERRWRLNGVVGQYPFGLEGRVESDYDITRTVKFIVDMTNVSITRQAVYTATITSTGEIKHCAPAEDCDFEAMKPINKARIRIFENVADALDTNNQIVSFFFDQLDLLVTKTAAAAVGGEVPVGSYPGYSLAGTVGVEFANEAQEDEGCGPKGSPGQPGCESIDCCCTLDAENAVYPGAANTIAPNGTTTIGTTLTITVQIPLLGGSNCLGWPELSITFPGADTTAGVFGFDDTFQPQIQQFATGLSVTSVTGLGHNGSRTLTINNPVVCGSTLDIRWQMVALIPTNGLHSAGVLVFNDVGVCDPSVNPIVGPSFSVTNGGTNSPPHKPPTTPPDPPPNDGFPLDIIGQDPNTPQNVLYMASYEVIP